MILFIVVWKITRVYRKGQIYRRGYSVNGDKLTRR